MNILNSIDLRGRLFAIFTLIFLLTLGILAAYLGGTARAVELNAVADETFAEARQVFALKQALGAMELAHNHYEATGSLDDLAAFYGQVYRLEELIEAMDLFAEPEQSQALEEFGEGVYEYVDLFAQVQEAMLDEDWESVEAVDEQIYEMLPGLFGRLDAILVSSEEQLDEINAEIEWFQRMVLSGAWLGLALFAGLAGMAMLLIHSQVNTPIAALNRAVQQLEAGQMDAGPVQKLAMRQDEIGAIASSLLEVSERLAGRQADLEAEAARIRARIR